PPGAYQAATGAGGEAGGAAKAAATAKVARDAAADAQRAADAVDHAVTAVINAVDAAKSAASAGANAAAAADAAAQAGGYSQAAGAQAERAKAAAAKARAAAATATSAANSAEALARRAATAAQQAKAAAQDAARHANNAAQAAEEAAAHAGQAAGDANQATLHAQAAVAAANTASDAAAAARQVEETARAAEAAQLAAEKDKKIQQAQEVKKQYDERGAQDREDRAEAARVDAETKKLLTDAVAPGTDPATAVRMGRQAAVSLFSDGGPWTSQAAKDALTGSDGDVLEWLKQRRALAAEHDDLSRVAHLAESTNPRLRTAALAAVNGSPQDIQAFLNGGQDAAMAEDYRVEILRIISQGGRAVKEAGSRAVDANTPAAFHQFLDTDQYRAREEDDRVTALTLTAGGGPQLTASAQVALAGAPTQLRNFVAVAQYRAAEQDQQSAVHAADIQRIVADASNTAAIAQETAATATAAALTAQGAAAEAQKYADQARRSADEANGYADQARQSSDRADKSAKQAATSAQQAKSAEKSARADASAATKSAAWASYSASKAASYASSAYGSATQARNSALAAGRSAEEAAQAGTEAMRTAADKIAAEERARAAQQSQPPSTPPPPGTVSVGDADGHDYTSDEDDPKKHPPFHEPSGWEKFWRNLGSQGQPDPMLTIVGGAELWACHAGSMSCELFRYWEKKSGKPFNFSADQMRDLYTNPTMQTDLNERAAKYAQSAAEKCSGGVGTTCTVKLDSNWLGFTYKYPGSKDHIFALHSIQYRVSGDVTATVVSPGKVRLSGDYRFDVKKEYNFDMDKPPIDVWGIPVDVKMLALAPSQGYARDFTVQGSSTGHVDTTTG
ncbi:hypothetical protein ACFVYI_12945, partial [Kitasatospora sp. NPDC058218]